MTENNLINFTLKKKIIQNKTTKKKLKKNEVISIKKKYKGETRDSNPYTLISQTKYFTFKLLSPK